jgi:DNA-binding response OmpR family regulator
MAKKTVLMVDDDHRTVELVKLYLERDNYQVITAYDGLDALAKAKAAKPDLIVLDLMLPGLDGVSICRQLRELFSVPIIMLTARTTEQDRVVGLDSGADDYMTKPFSPRELMARIRAVLRRMADESLASPPAPIDCGPIHINPVSREVTVNARPVELTRIEFQILWTLAGEPGRIFGRDQLISKVFGYDYEGFDRVVDVHVHRLRRKLEPDNDKSTLIQSIYGEGYRLSKPKPA